MRDTIHIRVSLAVLLIDDFTGKIITSPSMRVTARGGGKPVRKTEGFWVFLNLTSPETEVAVDGPCYYSERQTIAFKELDSANPVVRIRLRPDRTYKLPKGTICMTAVLPKHASLMVFNEQGSDYKKLLVDYEKGSKEISLYQGGRQELEGKICCITGKKETKEFIRLGALKDREKGLYLLEQAPEDGYKKIGTKIYPVSYTKARDAGEYFLPLSGGGQTETEYTCLFELDGIREEQKIVMKEGWVNRIRWDGPDVIGRETGKKQRKR